MDDLLTDEVSLIRKNGDRIDSIPASVQRNKIYIGYTSLQIEDGDILIRKLKNGKEEKYSLLQLNYHEDKDLGYIEMDVQKETKAHDTTNTHIVSNTAQGFAAIPKETDSVFIVHGRDDSTKMVVAQFLKKLGLEPIILHEQANKGRTIIEKFEDHSSNVKYAVVLLTPDDLGGLRSEPTKQSPRARQNVVFEMGHFFGKLGRRRVFALLSPEVERPSDIEGILYIPLDKKDEWKEILLREINAAKLNEIDTNTIINLKSKPDINIEITLGKWELRDIDKISHPEIFVFTAFNSGGETTLDSYGIMVKDTSGEKEIPDIYPLGPAKYYLDEAGFPREVNNFSYPCKVSKDDLCSVGKYMDGIIKRLTKNGYNGKVELIAYFRDISKNIYKSKPYSINIDEWI